MGEPITLTWGDVWLFLLALAGGLSTLSAGVAVIANIVHKAKEPNKKQDERLKKLEDDVKEIKERLAQGDQRFELDAIKLASLEKSVRDTNKVIIESLQALTTHAIDGNNKEQLKNAEQALHNYLMEKV